MNLLSILLILQKLMQEGSKSEIGYELKPPSFVGDSFSQFDFQFSQQKPLEMQSLDLPEVRSQNISIAKDQTQGYKKTLLILMVMVKMERLGYNQSDLKSLVEEQIVKIQNIESIENKLLDDRATEVSLGIISTMIGDAIIQIPRFTSLHSRLRRDDGPIIPEQQREMEHFPAQRQPQIICNICYQLTTRYCSQKCQHSFCLECTRGYVRENLNSGNYTVKCPEYDCHEQLSVATIKLVLQKQQLKRFLYFRDKNQRENNPDNKFCSMPDCGEMLQRLADKLKCPKCGEDYCQICVQKYHEGNPCDIVLKNTLEQTYRVFKIKKCPNCKSPIEKSDGCNHMVCKKCKHQFCWLCLSKYSRHHYRYYNCIGCPGMQFQEEGEMLLERSKQICLFAFLPFILILLLVCFAAAIPIFMIGCFIYKPCYWVGEEKEFLEAVLARKMCCCLGSCIIKITTWLLLQPRAALYAALIAPAKLTYLFCTEICKIFD